MSNPEDKPKIIVDEDWKTQVQAEKEALDKAESGEAEGGKPDDEAVSASASESAPGDAEQPMPPPPPASLAQVLTIFATQATMSLQEAAHPETKDAASHLAYAKHFIDTLAVLEEKTKGNVSAEEASMLENMLHELRMAYVSMTR